MTGVGRHAGGTVLAGSALPGQANHPGAARRAVRLVPIFGAYGFASHASDGSGSAWLSRHGTRTAGGARDASAVAADHVLPADGTVRLRLLRIGTRGDTAGAGCLSKVAEIGGGTAAARGAR